jgi:F-type H+-transporting ATPase subunit b
VTAAGVALCAALLLAAGNASAAGDSLVLLPDFLGKLPLMIVLFVLLMFPANAMLFKPIFKILDEREERTAGTRRRAVQVTADAEETLAKYEAAVREVREQSESDRKAQIAQARQENAALTAEARSAAESELERAGSELAAALDESRATLRAQAETIAEEAATQVLGRPL